MRALLPLLFFSLLCTTGCEPAMRASAQATPACTADADCILLDECGCSCRAERVGALPPIVCTLVCGGHPCEGHRAVCNAGRCVMR